MPTVESPIEKIKPVSNAREFEHVVTLASKFNKLNKDEQKLFFNLLDFLARNYNNAE